MVSVSSRNRIEQGCVRRIAEIVTIVLLCLAPYQVHAQSLDKERFDCLIEPKMTVMVGAPTQGVIDTVEVERSQLVSAGQVPVYGRPRVRRFRRDMLDLFLTDPDAAMRKFRSERGSHGS